MQANERRILGHKNVSCQYGNSCELIRMTSNVIKKNVLGIIVTRMKEKAMERSSKLMFSCLL